MSAVTVAVVFGFLCCALLIRMIGLRQQRRQLRVVRVRPMRAVRAPRAMMDE
ncbi:hypothetical protein GV791_00105 [Nocardia cyriacigeorgica]|uniref:Uncharacterized protein n=1 Tax=Nocardia cyriacigeorgica TaxID=135487 RepID=A0A6P1CEC3_9NOCA|nr:hypothetical protein [Nocardia cyriacigeorgica]MBF6081078.1 hypothetical protein [Nocardia cyriacigeorgica]MBF6288796.1 hypothetical protein [Nocardia cyriacigeorgica]MBF6423909.1 hypothetical protein [Nocardia cyriacigeorgica]NEW30961.1 hypothetical protein [Nocardia cyriacigeorgica]BDT88317.1 hypothetical protein FMUAM8_40810 [Nocardia cyriacigeorgica]